MIPEVNPFFVLIDDPSGKEVIHPTVHYIFSDDNQEPITAAALTAAEDATVHEQNHDGHRIVIVDMAADGKSMSKVKSLSPHWQITGAEVTSAPSWRGNTDTSKNLMLRLSGTEARVSSERPKMSDLSMPDLIAMLHNELNSLEPHIVNLTSDDNTKVTIEEQHISGTADGS